jgi:heat shock protein HslJ
MRANRTTGSGSRTAASVVAIAVAVAAALGACAGPTEEDTLSATEGLPDTTQALEAHTWVLDAGGSTPRVDADTTVTLAFDEGLVHGQAPCNTYRGPFTADGDSIEIGPLAVTRMACDEARTNAEGVYLGALERVDVVDVTDPTRVVLEGDDVHLAFLRVDAGTAIVGTWAVTSMRTSDAIESPIAGTEPTLVISAEGELRADAGCNPMSTRWTVDGRAVEIDPVRVGRKECPEPEGVMEQERALAAALEEASRVDISDRLTLFDDEGRIVLVAVRSDR